MSEHHPDDAFVRTLLAQDSVSEERYAEYRRQLDRQLEAARRLTTRRRRLGWIAAGVAAASLLLVLASRPWRSRPAPEIQSPAAGPLVIVRLPAAHWHEWAPYELELTADLIATATLGEPFRHDNDKVAVLHLLRLLKRSSRGGKPAEKDLPTFCCPYSGRGAPLRPETYRQGTRVLVYLQGSTKGDWGLLDLRPLDEDFERRELPGIERCLAVAAACESRDPQREYRRLLAPEAGGLDRAACSALSCRPDPRSADALLEQLERLRQRLVRAARPLPDARTGDEEETLARLTDLLALLHEPRAARPVVGCARHLPHGRRGPAYRHLPELCRSADEPTRAAVRVALMDDLEDPAMSVADHGPAALALAAVADRRAAELLVRHQGRRPISDVNVQAARALGQLHKSLGPAGRDLAREAWLALLRSYRPPALPPPADRQLLREVVRLLSEQGLGTEQKKEVREIFDRSASAWFRRELEPLLN
jgi:hypothetical protein